MERLPMFLVFSALFLAASADQLLILQTPKSIELKGDSYLTPETVEDVLSASLGYSVPHDETSSWDGLVINDPFNLADGIVNVVVEGIDSLSLKDARTFDVLGSGDPLTGLVRNVESHQGTKIDLDLKTDVTESLGEIKPATIRSTEYLKPKSVKADADFLKQIAIIDGLTEFFKSSDRIPTATVVRTSLSAVLKEHEAGSDANTEVFKVLRNAITALSTAANKAHKGNAVISVLATADTAAHRTKRQAEGAAAAGDLNIVDGYGSDYPVIFNIILWFTIVMLLTLLAISYAIGGMDPGRDSIIYRMTSTRMKKDN